MCWHLPENHGSLSYDPLTFCPHPPVYADKLAAASDSALAKDTFSLAQVLLSLQKNAATYETVV